MVPRWIKHLKQEGRIQEHMAIIWEPPGHWMMVLDRRERIEVWNSYDVGQFQVTDHQEGWMRKASELSGKPVVLEFMGQQSRQDHNTCAYHVLQWVRDMVSDDEVQKVKVEHRYKVEGVRLWVKQVLTDLGYRVGRGIRLGRDRVRLRGVGRLGLAEHNREGYLCRQMMKMPGERRRDQVQKWAEQTGQAVREQVRKTKGGVGQMKAVLLSHNMGGGFIDKLAGLRRWIETSQQEPMCIALQETWLQEEQVARGHVSKAVHFELLGYEFIGNQHSDVFMAGRAGLCVLVHRQLRKNVEFENLVMGRGMAEGRFVAVPIRTLVAEQRLWVCSVYAPVQTKEREEFLHVALPECMKEVAEHMGDKDLLWIGMDANAVMNVELDTQIIKAGDDFRTGLRELDKSSVSFQEWVADMELNDGWRQLHAEEFQTSKTRELEAHKVRKRIDYVLTSPLTSQLIESVEMLGCSDMEWISDHKLMVCKMVGMSTIRQIMKAIRQRQIFDPRCVQKHAVQIQQGVEAMVIREDSMKGVAQKAQVIMKQEPGMHKTRKFKYISEKRQHSELGQALEKVLKEVTMALKKKQGYSTAQIRSRIEKEVIQMEGLKNKASLQAVLGLEGRLNWKWLVQIKRQLHLALVEEERQVRQQMIKMGRIKAECGEFYMPWAKHAYARGKMWKRPEVGILALKNQEGQMVTGNLSGEVIMEYMKKQWSQVPGEYRTSFSFQKIAPRSKVEGILNKVITAREVQVQIDSLKKEKSPGTDLVPNEAWMGWSMQGYQALAVLFQKVFEGSEGIPADWKQVIIKWIYKTGDPFWMQNYRPIALGNTLSKIYMRILNARLEELVEETGIVSEVQQGFRADRSCAGAVLVMQLLALQRGKARQPFYMASVDISKAYDTVNHTCLWEILKAKGITGQWLRSVQEMYSGGQLVSDTVQGESDAVTVHRGIRQG